MLETNLVNLKPPFACSATKSSERFPLLQGRCFGCRYQCASARSWHMLASPSIHACAGRIDRQRFLKLGPSATENEVRINPLVSLRLEETYPPCRRKRHTCVDEIRSVCGSDFEANLVRLTEHCSRIDPGTSLRRSILCELCRVYADAILDGVTGITLGLGPL